MRGTSKVKANHKYKCLLKLPILRGQHCTSNANPSGLGTRRCQPHKEGMAFGTLLAHVHADLRQGQGQESPLRAPIGSPGDLQRGARDCD